MNSWTCRGKRTKTRSAVLILPAFICVLFLVLVSDRGSPVRFEQVTFPSLKDVPESAWEKLSQKTIYFGHQSVGYNIVDGIRDIMKVHPRIRLSIVETHNPEDLTVPMFCHSRVGTNKDPQSKIDAFADYMENGLADKVDIAFFKFCYIDVRAGTDAGGVFSDYKNTMTRLRTKYPDTAFVHVTVPHTIVQTGIKAGIKKIIGRPVHGYADNIVRSRFNEMLRSEYEGKEPLFDLAKRETTSLDGKQASFEEGGTTFHGIVPSYTFDGGHLDEAGRRIVAEQLLISLAILAE